jgi:hypothetical protein
VHGRSSLYGRDLLTPRAASQPGACLGHGLREEATVVARVEAAELVRFRDQVDAARRGRRGIQRGVDGEQGVAVEVRPPVLVPRQHRATGVAALGLGR